MLPTASSDCAYSSAWIARKAKAVVVIAEATSRAAMRIDTRQDRLSLDRVRVTEESSCISVSEGPFRPIQYG